MTGKELQGHRRNLIWAKILTGGVAAVFFALVNMIFLPGAGMEVRADSIGVSTADALKVAINNAACDTITIDSDIDIVYAENESAPKLYRPLTINLNGKKITVNGTFIDILSGGALTITDNLVTETVNDVTASKDKYGNKAFYDLNTNTLTYYVTESTVTDVGETTESVKEHIVTGAGSITGTRDGFAVFYLDVGKLTIQNGMIAGSQSRAVNMIGHSTLNINGGYLCGNNKSGAGNGGAICALGGACTVNLDGGVIVANTAENGGAIYLDSANMNMTGGIIAGNEATVNGGGIYVNGTGNITMSGVSTYITNNRASLLNDYNNRGGGGIIMNGNGKFTFSSGYITGNYAASGGGVYATNNSGAKFEMTSGFLSANCAEIGEGGGIRVGAGCLADFQGGYITNNITNTTEHWGGGGIFIAENAAGYAKKVLVKSNHAGGFGGGVAGCSTGQIYMSETDTVNTGVAIYSNTADGENLSGGISAKHDDHLYASRDEVFRLDENYQDFFSMLYSHVVDIMLGGGHHNWSGSIDGNAVTIAVNGIAVSNSVAGLTAKIMEVDTMAAEQAGVARVYVSGNKANTHGGGILCNGYMIFGEPPSSITASTRIEVHGTVQYLDWQSLPIAMTDNQFTFTVIPNGQANAITTGVNYSNGEVTFKHRLIFPDDGTYEYIVEQTSPDFTNSKIDRTDYKITVVIASDLVPTVEIPKPDGGTIAVNMRTISSVTLAKGDSATDTWADLGTAYTDHTNEQYNHAVAVHLSDPADSSAYSFTNYNLTTPPPSAGGATDNSSGSTVQPSAPIETPGTEISEEVFTQTVEGHLPQTGQNWMSVILLACAGCLCFIIGVVLKRVEHEWD